MFFKAQGAFVIDNKVSRRKFPPAICPISSYHARWYRWTGRPARSCVAIFTSGTFSRR